MPRNGPKTPKIITSHDVREPLKQVLLALRDVIMFCPIAARIRRGFFTLGTDVDCPEMSQKSGFGTYLLESAPLYSQTHQPCSESLAACPS